MRCDAIQELADRFSEARMEEAPVVIGPLAVDATGVAWRVC